MNRIGAIGAVLVVVAGCGSATVKQNTNAGGNGGGLQNAGGTRAASGGLAGAGGSGLGGAPAPLDKLVIDAPHDHATVSGVVQISGWARGFANVEAWDDTHGNTTPPLAQATPASDGSFTMQVNTGGLASGATTWTIWAWDTPAGTPANLSDDVARTTSPAAGFTHRRPGIRTCWTSTSATPRSTTATSPAATPTAS